MSEEKKTVELKDEELENVTGGSVFEVDNSIIGKWYKKDDSPDLEIYFYPMEILNNQYIYVSNFSQGYTCIKISNLSQQKTHFCLPRQSAFFE